MTSDNHGLRIWPRVVSCARTDCRTSLTEDTAVTCPHGETFCESCTWEEACIGCAFEATFPDRLDPTSPRAYAWPDDSAASDIRDDRDHEAGARVARYSDRRDDSA